MVSVAKIKTWIRSWFTPDAVFNWVEGSDYTQLPTRGSKGAAGLDLYCAEKIRIRPGETVLVKTGLKCKFNPGWGAFLWDRSGLGAGGVHRFAGLIDCDYRGEWRVVLHSNKKEAMTLTPGDRIAQVVFQRVWTGQPHFGPVGDDTERGEGGFGSTGK